MNSANGTNEAQTNKKLADALERRLGPEEVATDLTVEEFGEALRAAGFLTEEDATANLSASDGSSRDDDLELFGTGVADPQPGREDATGAPSEVAAQVAENMKQSSDPEDYSTGMQRDTRSCSDPPTGDTPLSELTGSASGMAPEGEGGELTGDGVEAYAHGVEGLDTSGGEADEDDPGNYDTGVEY